MIVAVFFLEEDFKKKVIEIEMVGGVASITGQDFIMEACIVGE